MTRVGCIWSFFFLFSLSLGWTRAQGQQPQTNFTRPVFHCGGDLVADSGFIGSEGFPSPYKPNSKCTWHITVPEGNVVMLHFRFFDLEADAQCRYDYLDVYNGKSNMMPKLGRFCGTFRPNNLVSSSNTMMLEMVSDEGTQGRGFVAYFSGEKPDDQRICKEKITKAQGEITTPNWPNEQYPAGVSCSWLITVEPDMVIQVMFNKFDLEPDSYCRYDHVAFYNGGERDRSRLIGKYCGDRVPEPIISSSNVMLVHFESDSSVTYNGFLATYTSVPHGSQIPSVDSGAGVGSVPSRPNVRPIAPARPAITTTTTKPPAPAPVPTRKTTPVKPTGRRVPGTTGQDRRPAVRRPIPQNPLCAKACKRNGSIKPSFCASEFVITGKVTSVTPGPGGVAHISVSLIKAYKQGRLTLTEVGEITSVKLVSQCKKCPLLRRGLNYIIMGQVDDEGRGTLEPGAFTAPYKAPHHRLLMNFKNQSC
ncbi:procollagen C-endopeptidase enhancer a [Myripristis murdjan]|uniref:Procollagen C-endopeptidase enhancer a n=1 Tax=Myripristis murdjan TaxID=586833 RepID=A0A668AMZ0_9TELE|nr:procollagen C-endopeptidase enhancer 2-like [Myripristis murdjan]